jgi:hypothetical protein
MAFEKCPTCKTQIGGGFTDRVYLYKCKYCQEIVCSNCIKRGWISTTCPHCDKQIDVNTRLKV